MKTWDVIIIGGGIIGLSLSIELRKRGAAVLVVERSEPGREASYAAGGMLVDCSLETPTGLQELASASARMYPEFAYELETGSGIKVDLRDYGTILFLSDDHAEFARSFTKAEIPRLEPALAEGNLPRHAVFLRERSVDPRALSTAAVKVAKNRGVDFSSGDEVTAVHQSEGKVTGVKTVKTSFAAPKVVNCAGAWAGAIAPVALPTRPVKGQMLCLAMPSRTLLQHVVRSPKVYLIPRSDGRLLIGATVEEAGFDKRTVPSTLQRQHQAAFELMPKLRDAKILEDWAGLRPGTPDGLPILGETDVPGYYVATGHFRDGILLAPVTAQLMAQVVSNEKAAYDISGFSLQRFS